MMGGSEQEYSPEMKRRAFELRGQGVSFRAIANRLGEETGVAPPARTIANWCYSVAGRALIEHAKAQLAATLADRSNHALPRVCTTRWTTRSSGATPRPWTRSPDPW